MGMFSSLMNSKYFPKRTKLLLYKVGIRSAIVYAFPIWFSISPIVAKELEICERKCLRKCIDKNYQNHTKRYSNTYIYEQADVIPFCRYAFLLQKKFVENLASHDNCLMNEIHELEGQIDWFSHPYLSPIGILMESADVDPNMTTTPDFYLKSHPGSHRG